MKNLVILNDAPYGNERSYNGLRLAFSLAKNEGEEVRIFLIGDAAACAKHGQKTPNGYYNIESMLKGISARGAEIAVCGSCMDARAIDAGDLVPGSTRGSIDVLTAWTREADKVMVF
jgi:uncharacterized protein involved in oxidation of intracellular sulfur